MTGETGKGSVCKVWQFKVEFKTDFKIFFRIKLN
jgi:hypothetical protein